MRFKPQYKTNKGARAFVAAADWLGLPPGLSWVYLNWGVEAARQADADDAWQNYVGDLS